MKEIQDFNVTVGTCSDNDGLVKVTAYGTYKGKRFSLPLVLTSEFLNDSDFEQNVYNLILSEIKEMHKRDFGDEGGEDKWRQFLKEKKMSESNF